MQYAKVTHVSEKHHRMICVTKKREKENTTIRIKLIRNVKQLSFK